MSSTITTETRTRGDVISLLRANGITPTSQRVEIGYFLFSCPQHVTAEGLLDRVSHGPNSVSKATVYNTLALFADRGLIREVIIDPTKRFYDTNLASHHHIYHTDTGVLEDVCADHIKISQLPDLPDDTAVEGVDIIVRVHSRK